MTPFVETILPQEDIALFRKIREVVQTLPDFDLGECCRKKIVLSCHMLARAVGAEYQLEVVDGKFVGMFDHSWLLTRNGNIIDVYPVGILDGPLLVDNNGCVAPGRKLYREGSTESLSRSTAIPFDHPDFDKAVKIIGTRLQARRETLEGKV